MPDLAVTYESLLADVGAYLGYGPDPEAFTSEQLADVEQALRGGLRQFYTPPPANGQAPHPWSFLRPVTTLSTVANQADYTLPADFAALLGNLTIRTTTSSYLPILVVGEGQIRQGRSAWTGRTGTPTAVAQRVKPFQPGAPQRWELLFDPAPDAVYTIEYQYLVNPQALSRTNPYPYGGAQHAQTILEACLAQAELQKYDMAGVHAASFAAALAGSIQIDKQQGRGEHLGYNGDPGTPESLDPRLGGLWRNSVRATYNGTQY